MPDRRSYAVGKHWVTRIKAPAETGEKRNIRTLKRLRPDEGKAGEELKAKKAQERPNRGKRRNGKKSLKIAIPAAVEGQEEDDDPADQFK